MNLRHILFETDFRTEELKSLLRALPPRTLGGLTSAGREVIAKVYFPQEKTVVSLSCDTDGVHVNVPREATKIRGSGGEHEFRKLSFEYKGATYEIFDYSTFRIPDRR